MLRPDHQTLTEAQAVCVRHSLTLVKVLPNRSQAAFVAHARNDRGADIMIKKAASPKRAAREVQSNQRWAGVGAATFSVELEPGVLIREFAQGLCLKELPGFGVKFAPEVGELLARMHSVKLAERGVFVPARDYIKERANKQKGKLRFSRGHYRVFREATDQLLRGIDLGNSMVHGDFSGGNVMVADKRLYAFDARGFYGGEALDLCGYVMHIPHTDPLELLKEVLVGYGEAPQGLAATLAWRIVISAQRSRYGPSHAALLDRIVAAGSIEVINDWLAPKPVESASKAVIAATGDTGPGANRQRVERLLADQMIGPRYKGENAAIIKFPSAEAL